jgi:phosphonate transport system ATP-binding protein
MHTPPSAAAAIEVRSLSKHFNPQRAALNAVSLRVEPGEMVALLGASGSGKSTLLRHLSGLHRADPGTLSEVKVLGRTLQSRGRLSRETRALRQEMASIFQQFNLVDRLPVLSNVMVGALHRLPLWRSLLRAFPQDELQRAYDALRHVGIEACAWQRASTLSGGQQQRAAISRALVQGAKIILADEPIASLDPASSRRVMELLAQVNRERGVTVLVSLHQIDYAFAYCPRTVALRQGEVVYDGPTAALSEERLHQLYGTQAGELFTPSREAEPSRVAVPALAALPQAA